LINRKIFEIRDEEDTYGDPLVISWVSHVVDLQTRLDKVSEKLASQKVNVRDNKHPLLQSCYVQTQVESPEYYPSYEWNALKAPILRRSWRYSLVIRPEKGNVIGNLETLCVIVFDFVV
jgi:hypothetical protein